MVAKPSTQKGFDHSSKIPTQPATARGEARRQAIIDAAAEMFLKNGYENSSLEDLFARVGGSKASLYQYFGSKENLFYEIITRGTERFIQELPIPKFADDDITATLQVIGHQYLHGVTLPTQREWYRLLMSVLPRYPEIAQDFFHRCELSTSRALASYLTLQREKGRVAGGDMEVTASHFFHLLRDRADFRSLLGLPPFTSEYPVEAHVPNIVDLFLHGCAASEKSDATTEPARKARKQSR